VSLLIIIIVLVVLFGGFGYGYGSGGAYPYRGFALPSVGGLLLLILVLYLLGVFR
jgi:hypothetical protein